MTDQEKRENVIKGLECCLKDDCDNCPYYDPEVDHDCDYFGKCLRRNMYADALALLKAEEQEIEDLKQEIEGHKDNLRETLDEMMRIWDELQAQNPKVLSFAEAMLDTDRDVVWVEFRDDPIVEAVITGFAVNEYADVYCAGFDSEDGTIRLSADQCGKIWRPWSLRPTDAQRETVKWE